MVGTRYEIKKLDQNVNYSLWIVKMKAILTKEKLQNTLIGKEKMTGTDEEKVEVDQSAMATLFMCISNEALWEAIVEQTIENVWGKLAALYQDKTFTGKMTLK